jgi:hypothetical protein
MGFPMALPSIEFPGARRKAAVKFAKLVFWTAAIWGVLIITPLYFMFDLIGRNDPPPVTHPGFFYGFVGAALTWQIVFFLIARDPLRHRLLMIPSVVEKFTYGIAVGLLVMQGRMHPADMIFGGVDLLLGILFVVAYFNTRAESLNRIQGNNLDKSQAA